MAGDAYKKAGVDIEAADRMIDRIKPLAAATHRAGVMGSLGGFGGLFHLKNQFKDPVLVSGTDGVGTKLLVAQQLNRHDSIGIDLVAMCVNDIVVLGAEPLFFLDYFATGHLDASIGEDVIAGIAKGCKESGCALLGGETAEMPGMYEPGHYDLAGFAVGAVERDSIVDGKSIAPGDALVGLPSSGLHSNGYSLVRKVISDSNIDVTARPSGWTEPLGDVLMKPTTLYVKPLLEIHRTVGFLGAAHITGGGLPGNIIRVLPEGCTAVVDLDSWTIPPVFRLLQEAGNLTQDDMLSTFNCGVGMVVIVREEHAASVCETTGGFIMGHISAGERGVVCQ